MIVLFLGLVGQLTYLQVVAADELDERPGNVRVLPARLSAGRAARSSPPTAYVLAESVPADDELEQQRVYPPETASCSRTSSATSRSLRHDRRRGRVQRRARRAATFDSRRRQPRRRPQRAQTARHRRAHDATPAQQLAAERSRDERGSVVVLDVAHRAIVAAYSNPTFDPNLLATPRHEVAQAALHVAQRRPPDNPLLPRAWRELYPPGSTFKVVTPRRSRSTEQRRRSTTHVSRVTRAPAAADDQHAAELRRRALRRHARGDVHRCRATRRSASSASTSASSSPTGIAATSASNDRPPPTPTSTRRRAQHRARRPGRSSANQPLFALAAIGQGDVAVTPLEMALVAAVGRERRRDDRPHVARPRRGRRRQRRARHGRRRRSGSARWSPTTARP